MHSEKSMSKLKNCMYRAAYTVTALKNMVGMTTYLNKKTNKIPIFYLLKNSVCQRLWQGHKVLLPGLNDFDFSAPKEILN